MKIFRQQPKLTDRDRERLLSAGYIQNWNKLVQLLREKPPSKDDLKRLVILENEKESPRQAIVEKLVIQIQKAERREINRALRESRKQVST